MKLKNKILALLLAASMAFSVSACGSADAGNKDGQTKTEDNADADVYASSVEKMKDVSSMNGKMDMEIDMSIGAGGEVQSMQTATTMDMSCLYNPARIKIEMNMDAGNDTTMNMQAYVEEGEDGTYTMYAYDGVNWSSQTLDADAVKQYDAASNMTGYMQDSYHFQDAGTEQVDGKSARKYTGAMTGDDMREAIMATGALNSLSALGLDDSQMDTMFKDIGELPITLWIDETDLYPVKYEMDMADLMNSLMSGYIEAMGEEAEGVTIEFAKAKVVMTCSDFNAVTEFSIPDEAKGASPAA